MTIKLKRAYDAPAARDGVRVLVDRLWPRGVSKERLHVAHWMRDVAPTTELRQWFQHDPAKWPEFRKRFLAELASRDAELRELRQLARKRVVTLVFAARDAEQCNATVLKEYLESHPARKPRS